MNYSDPTKLGLLACPGGERFAEQVLKRLSTIYRHRFERKVQVMADRYHISKELVTRKINFANDVYSSMLCIPGNVNEYRAPRFKVNARYTWFANGEIKTEILDSIRGKDLYIFQDVENRQPCRFNDGRDERELSVNDHVMNTLVTIDAAIQAGAERITLVMPAYPYSRQHKKKGREGLTAARLGQIFENYGVQRIITLDIHSREIENCFNKLRLENLHASYQVIEKLAGIVDVSDENLVVLSPDTGAVDRNKFYASTLQKPLAMLYKERDYSKVTKDATDSNITEMKLLGDIHGKIVFMADDMLGTGGTLLKAMRYLKDQGATKVICAVSLPLFSANAIDDFDKAYREGLFYRIIGTNAVHHGQLLKKEWYIEADVTTLFAQIISLLHHNRSLSPMLDNREIIAKKIKKAMAAQAAHQPTLPL
ncbi:MAG TPA: ribose-phosphate diphosphokinase [Spirochaetales bacterium]|nr:ribose-phosphate diphosphokinase [Spirochaetales bacterium]HPM72549.1 ribose-phosphate diphosphokinase [Spirochaetales bacterium]